MLVALAQPQPDAVMQRICLSISTVLVPCKTCCQLATYTSFVMLWSVHLCVLQMPVLTMLAKCLVLHEFDSPLSSLLYMHHVPALILGKLSHAIVELKNTAYTQSNIHAKFHFFAVF